MSSSISVSESATAARPSPWRRLLALYGASTLLFGAGLMALLLALDPYDTGRLALFGGYGVPHFGQRLTMASIARRADVDTAIIGNSTIQLLDPARLGAAIGGRAVTLATPGTGPREQIALARWLIDHHRAGLRGLVIGIDGTWCRGDGALPLANPFPFWLYAEDPGDYALGLMRFKTLEAAAGKLRLILGRAKPAPADGYDDYERDHVWHPMAAAEAMGGPETPAEGAASAAPDFAAAPLLRQLLAVLPPEATVVLVVPPRYRAAAPAPGSPAAAQEQACLRLYGEIARGRPRTALIDFAARPAFSDAADLWWDPIHYRAPVAREMEAEIATALREAK
jgi:hypothetical protein